jgi:hypothetical protein
LKTLNPEFLVSLGLIYGLLEPVTKEFLAKKFGLPETYPDTPLPNSSSK